MDFDGIAHAWANSKSLTSPTILTALLAYDVRQLGQLRVSVARYAQLAHAVELIDVLSSFELAKQRLEEARQAAVRMADVAAQLVQHTSGVPDLALASVKQAVDAQEAAHVALGKAQSGREKIHAAVVLELADVAASKALEASEAADRLSVALNLLVRATTPFGTQEAIGPLDPAERGGLQ
ncbi:MAG: hypothetical protein JWP29_2440 [Rhodoferax sp.]|nr:hypothetical protein [Rhodoferax sp.]